MAVYVVIEIKILNKDMYDEYIAQVPAIVKRYGGNYLARGEKIIGLSGDWNPERMILLKFDSQEQVREWLTSPEYAIIASLRTRSTISRAIAIEGCTEP